MNKEQQFLYKLKDFDLTNPESKRIYNQKLFSPVSRVYGKITSLLSFGQDGVWKKKLIKMLPNKHSYRIMDLACGPGDITFLLAKKYPKANIIGVDLNRQMLNKAKEALDKHNGQYKKRITFKEGDMNQLEYEDSSIDLLTGGYALRNAPDLDKTLDEIKRVLKPGALAAFLDFSKSENSLLQKLQIGLLSYWGKLWGLLFHKNPEVYGYIAESLKKFPHARAFHDLLIKKGFTVLKHKAYFWGILRLTVVENQV